MEGLLPESGYVFTVENGRASRPQYGTRLFERLRTTASRLVLTFHGQGHQSASLLLAAGAG